MQYEFYRIANAVDPRVQPKPPPRPKKQKKANGVSAPNSHAVEIDARTVLHFGPTEKLTSELIKKRRKVLATMCHPDRGGSAEAMAKVNAAADVLLKNLK
jgi:hypothetical protein